ncbi:[citrate (pro-3S)-lyase] ligase [Clostridiales bacterium F-3ap]|uniref:[Citrate [pro-3S]-lyase] ligase n=2 Tax=Anaerotalea alkaliphila TaxID=2662126 RepID=A0A7X5HUE4_9FIRM|nr:[citrate (pro-3S)-lyase] ligase [Anaerotalea alkaliphila]
MHMKSEKEEVLRFLDGQGIGFEEDVEYTMVLEEGEKVVGTGSLNRNVLKCIAVDGEHRSMGLMNRIVGHLIQEAYQRGETHLFVYTKPSNEVLFTQLGFHKIISLHDEVLLLENSGDGFSDYLKALGGCKVEGERIASIVVNCNPFTKGHRHLIEKAAVENDWLHVFVVWEGKSLFPSDVRHALVEEGTKDIRNVTVHRGKDYIISAATFPSYFLKEGQDAVEIHGKLDLCLFAAFIAPALGITRRYVGEEPYCPVTKKYNEIMKEILPAYGIEVCEIPRLSADGDAISASKVRRLIRRDDYMSLWRIVPETTYRFLLSEEGRKIAATIKESQSRH